MKLGPNDCPNVINTDMDLLRELTVEDEDYVPILEALEEAVRSLPGNKRGGIAKNAKGMFRSNPGLVVGAAYMALAAHDKYKKNKRNTISLHAKDAYERKMMTDIVDALTRGGKFKVHRTKFEHGGRTWVLKRLGH